MTSDLQVTVTKQRVCAAIDVGFFVRVSLTTSQTFGIGRAIQELLNHLPHFQDLDFTLIGLCNFDNDLFLSSYLTTNFQNSSGEVKLPTVPAIRSRTGISVVYDLLAPAYISSVIQQYNPLTRGGYSTVQSMFLRGSVKALKIFDLRPHFQPEQFDVFFSTYSPLPSVAITKHLPRVIQIFDLIPILQPQFTDAVQTGEMQRIVDSIDTNTDWIICNSKSVQNDVCRHTGIESERVMVVPLAAAEHFVPETDTNKLATVREKFAIPSGPFLLSVATWQPRKNIPHLIHSFFQLLDQHPESDAHLVLVGNPGSEHTAVYESIQQSKFKDRIVFTGYVPEQDISTLYSAASAFVFPSLAEGFGLPPLEAMRCGTPVICSDTTSLPEVVGDAALLVDPASISELSEAMWRLLTDDNLRETLRQKGLKRAQDFTWERYCKGVAECLTRAALATKR